MPKKSNENIAVRIYAAGFAACFYSPVPTNIHQPLKDPRGGIV